MIFIKFHGRCGDQFFQYAFARKIQLKMNDNSKMVFNFHNEELWKKKLNDQSFRNDLQFFKVVENECSFSQIDYLDVYGTKAQKRLVKSYAFIKKISTKLNFIFLAKNYHKKLQKNGIYIDDKYFNLLKYPTKKCNVFIEGYFEDYHFYYEDELIRLLTKELTPVKEVTRDLDFLNKIRNHNSICVSIRSWGEVGKIDNVFTSRMLCEEKYFSKALEIMSNKVPNALFVIFSDDVDWAKKMIGNKYNALFESGKNTIDEKVYLMSNCKHFIISNSSFSWWTQFLSLNENKIVISPNKWYKDKDDSRLIRPNWITIEV